MRTEEGSIGRLPREHRDLDELLGRLLAAASQGDLEAAAELARKFDEALRRHTAYEEQNLFSLEKGRKLFPPEHEEGARERLLRELSLEHVQIREVSEMLLRAVSEKRDLAAARALLPNLMRRWDAHCTREERELFGLLT